jgi:hypothetical protein
MWIAQKLRKARDRLAARDSSALIHYCLPAPAVYRKFYNQEQFFDAVDWSNWDAVIDGFERRINGWYFDHMRGGHASYLDLCSLCALIDFFSLHQAKLFWHSPTIYKEFLRKLDPEFRRKLPQRILVTRHERGSWRSGWLKDVADVFYAGVRCSLHHHGDLSSYAGMSGSGELAKLFPNAGSSLCGGHSYTLVVFDPCVLKTRLAAWFSAYCAALRTNPASQDASHFKARMRAIFGISIQ